MDKIIEILHSRNASIDKQESPTILNMISFPRKQRKQSHPQRSPDGTIPLFDLDVIEGEIIIEEGIRKKISKSIKKRKLNKKKDERPTRRRVDKYNNHSHSFLSVPTTSHIHVPTTAHIPVSTHVPTTAQIPVSTPVPTTAQIPVPTTAQIPINIRDQIQELGGSIDSIQLVCQKFIYLTDITSTNGRFSMPIKQLITEGFLTINERLMLEKEKKKFVKAIFMEPKGEVKTISLRRWEVGQSKSITYNLTTTWNKVVLLNNIRLDEGVQMWSFRVGTQLGFALVFLNR